MSDKKPSALLILHRSFVNLSPHETRLKNHIDIYLISADSVSAGSVVVVASASITSAGTSTS